MANSWTKSELKILKKRYSTRGAKYVAKRTGHPFHSVVAKANKLGLHSGTLRRFKQFEVNYLLQNYNKKPVDSIARTLKRSPLSVTNKARQLKIYVPKPKKWSEEELNQLRKLWIDKKFSIDEVAAKLNKTRSAAHFQALKMGLRRPEVWRFWTNDQTRYLRNNFKKKSYVQIAKDLGMTRISVFQKARRLGLKLRQSPRPWTQADDDYIRQNYKKIPTREIAEKLNRSLDAIINRAGPLGISAGRPVEWSKKEIEFLKEQYNQLRPEEIAKALGRSASAVRLHAAKLGLTRRYRRKRVKKKKTSSKEL